MIKATYIFNSYPKRDYAKGCQTVHGDVKPLALIVRGNFQSKKISNNAITLTLMT